MRTASGPSLRTVSWISPGRRTVRSTASSSTGRPLRSPRPGAPSAANTPTAIAIRTSGTTARTHDGVPRADGLGGAARLHQPLTSKKPCQPSSVNSDWWAWNMNFPGFGKRHSRIPRCPWQNITVSVYSDGSREVPVGK